MPENAASRALLARVGFSELRTQRNGAIVRGKPVDIVLFERRREDALDPRSAVGGAGRRGRRARRYGASANSIVMPASARPS